MLGVGKDDAAHMYTYIMARLKSCIYFFPWTMRSSLSIYLVVFDRTVYLVVDARHYGNVFYLCF